jgi:2-haloacid dehalogenase
LFTLTDNLLEVQTRQLEHGGIVDFFERRFSADGGKHHKPSRQAYACVERELGAEPSQLCMIACHSWDTLGAVAAGWQAAMIRRIGNDLLGGRRAWSAPRELFEQRGLSMRSNPSVAGGTRECGR